MSVTLSRTLIRTYWWMCVSLLLSGALALWIVQMYHVQTVFAMNLWFIVMLVIIEVMLAVWLMRRFNDMTISIMHTSLFLFSAVTGIIFSIIFSVYEIGSIHVAFFIVAGMFAVMGLFGYFSRTVITNIYAIIFFGLCGIGIMVIAGIFINMDRIDYVLSSVAVTVFMLLTAYNIPLIEKDDHGVTHATTITYDRGLCGALRLYVSLIHSLLVVLRISRR